MTRRAQKVGIGTTTHSETFYVVGSVGATKILVKETGGGSFQALIELENEDGQQKRIERLEGELESSRLRRTDP